MDLHLQGKRALVMASSQGLGLGIASELAKEGANVILCGRSSEKLEAQAAKLRAATNSEVLTSCVDLSNWDSVQATIDQVKSSWQGLDILVNNSGGPRPGIASEVERDEWLSYFQTMIASLMEMTRQFIEPMKAQKWGRILTVTSSGIEQPISNLGISNTLRSALVGWSKSLSNELAPFGITSNILIPGRIHTQRVDLLDAAAAERQGLPIEKIREQASAQIPVGRYGKVEEFAAVATFLLSEQASYVTGSKVRCDGGIISGI